MIAELAGCVALGLVLGCLLPRWISQSKALRVIQMIAMICMLITLGVRLGVQQAATPSWVGTFGRSLALAAGTILGSVLFTLPCARWLPEAPEVEAGVEMPNPLRLLGMALSSLAVGTVAGALWPVYFRSDALAPAAFYLLCLTMVLVGVEMTSSPGVGPSLKVLSPRLFLIPPLISIGSAFGGCAMGLALGLEPHRGAAIGAGCGWYSLTTIMLEKLDGPTLGSYGLLANLFREALSLIAIPLMARRHRGVLLLAPAGCTAMDTTFVMLGRLGGHRMQVMAFITGAICSLMVPYFVEFAYGMGR